MKPKLNKGYQVVNLYKAGNAKSCSIHRMVAIAFIENPLSNPEINHIDENKLNNKVSNLQWCTAKENSNWGTRKQRISKTVIQLYKDGVYKDRGYRPIFQIDANTGTIIRKFEGASEAARLFGFHQGNITSCCQGKLNQTKGFKWAYCEDYASA